MIFDNDKIMCYNEVNISFCCMGNFAPIQQKTLFILPCKMHTAKEKR